MAYPFELGWSQAFSDPLSAYEKVTNRETSGAESGIESASSSSSLDEPPKNSLGKLQVVTTTTKLKPQVSSSQILGMSGRPDLRSPVEIAVIYRGKLPLLNPVPLTDKIARLYLMKASAKTVQHDPNCTFAVMHIDEHYIKLYSMDEPRTLLFEIDCTKLDLVKLSRKDISFFYFTTYNSIETNIGRVESQAEKEANYSRYMCHIFHGTSPKMAERACKLIKTFIDNKSPYPQFSSQACTPRGSSQTCSASKSKTSKRVPQLSPSIPAQELQTVPEKTDKNCQSMDLLFSMEDPNQIDNVIDLFDMLSISSPKPIPVGTATKKVDLLSDLISPPVEVKQESSFLTQHLNYSMQMSTSYNTAPACVNPMQMQCTAVNPFANNLVAPANNLAPSFMPAMQHKQAFGNPFQVAPVMAPPLQPTLALPAPMKPMPNPVSSMQVLAQPPNFSNSNPFAAMAHNAATSSLSQTQLVARGANPFKSSPSQSLSSHSTRMSFGSDFDDFLSQTIKGQLNNKS